MGREEERERGKAWGEREAEKCEVRLAVMDDGKRGRERERIVEGKVREIGDGEG